MMGESPNWLEKDEFRLRAAFAGTRTYLGLGRAEARTQHCPVTPLDNLTW